MAGGEEACGSLILVGCGKMGTAMLRAGSRMVLPPLLVVEPEGRATFTSDASVEWHATADTLPGELCLMRWSLRSSRKLSMMCCLSPTLVRPETVFVSIVAGKTLTGSPSSRNRCAGPHDAQHARRDRTRDHCGLRSPW